MSIEEKNRVQDYLDRLERRRPDEFARIVAALEGLATDGPRETGEKVRKETEHLWCLRAGQQCLYGFYMPGRSFAFCLAAEKKRNKADPKILDRAERVCRAWKAQEKTKGKRT
ncbi:hypothetical protein JW916_02745 [Candidatus Sumerlaeota bacterium]|nr:hypothetical protein [Candidatus Sumerlaeota bacterium]